MADTILVIVEQREGKLNRVSIETIAGAQAIAAETGWTLEAAVAGSGVGEIAKEVAARKLAKVYRSNRRSWSRTLRVDSSRRSSSSSHSASRA